MVGGTVLCLVLAISSIIALPVTKEKHPPQQLTEEHKKDALKDEPPILQDLELSLEYGRYLKEVVQALESDTVFRKKLEQAEAEDIKSGQIARELHFVDHNVRTKLDELKRRELERLRHFALQEQEKASGIDRNKLKIPVHIDHRNPTRFEVEDLRKLIQQTTHDLEEVDKQRKKEFTEYEMKKEYEYEQQLAKLTPEERKKMEEKHTAEIKKHKDHPKLHHPGSKPQLEEVWQEQDHMKGEEFDPNSFFHLHDLDGNGVWDESEVKTLFLKELDKLYDPNASEDDIMERQEEMERMREHIFTEADADRDDLISYEEFLAQTRRNEFEQDEGWQGLDEQEMYSQQEYEQYQQQRMHELEAQGIHLPPNAVPIPHPSDPQYQQMYPQVHPGQVPVQQMQYDNQIPQMHPNQIPIHPNEIPIHPNQIPQMHPNQIPQMHPNQIPQMHPNQIPQMHPNQIPQMHPNQIPQMHPNQMPQMHPNQMPQMHPNQIPQMRPNQIPQVHPDQLQPGQVAPNQLPAAGYQIPQNDQQPIAGHEAQQQQQQVPQQQQQQQVPQQQQQQVPQQQQQQVPQHQQQQVPQQHQQQVPQQQQQHQQQVPQQQQQHQQQVPQQQQQQQVPQQQQQPTH